MLRRDPKTGRKIALGAVLAGIGGYLAGILTAPKSGKDTRQDIAEKAGEIKDDASGQLEAAHKELAETIKDAQAKTLSLGAKARSEFNEAMAAAKDAQNKAKTLLKAFKDGGSDDPELNRAVKQAKQAQKNLSRFLKG